MGLPSFLASLFADGRVHVDEDSSCSEPDCQEAERLIVEFEGQYREDLPGTAPAVSTSAVRYGAVTLYRACQFLVFRDVDAETIHGSLTGDVSESPSPSVHYSVDLTLRFLPDLMRRASARAVDDPLLSELVRLANQWPLSSVGIEGARPASVDALVDDPCLLSLYVDRIILRRDLARLEDLRVRAEAVRVIGAYPELSPKIARAAGVTGEFASSEETTK